MSENLKSISKEQFIDRLTNAITSKKKETFDELLVMNTTDIDDDDDVPSASALAAAKAYSAELNSDGHGQSDVEEEVHQYGFEDDEDIHAFKTRPKIPR